MWLLFFIPKKTTIVRTKAAEIPMKSKARISMSEMFI